MNGAEIRAKRTDLGLTQKELAEKLGVAPNTVARWERDERKCPPFIALALKALSKRSR